MGATNTYSTKTSIAYAIVAVGVHDANDATNTGFPSTSLAK